MKLFLHNNPNSLLESQSVPPSTKILDEIDALADSIKTNMGKDVKIPKDVLDSFMIKDTLNQDIWTKNEINPKVRSKLIQIAKDFYNNLNVHKKAIIKDIIFTGSLANFNWSKFSDIDLHVVLDYDQFDAEKQFVEDYFYAQKSIWNQEHDIKVFNYPLELYVQDINHKLNATAIYSVLNNKWIKKPKHESFELDKSAIKDKADNIIHNLKDIRQDYSDHQYKAVVDKVTKLKNKIKNMRNAGLEKGGEFSLENLVFKTLRRTPFLDILDSYKAKSYDKIMSLAEIDINELVVNKPKSNIEVGVILIKGAVLEDNSQRLYATITKNKLNLDRLKKDNSEGKPVTMAILGNQIYRIGLADGKFKAHGVAWNSNQSMLKTLGLTELAVGLNNNKTPLHWKTLETDNIAKAINSNSYQILDLPNIRWVG